VMQVLARLCREQGRTIVVVSHDPAVVDFAGRCIHLLDGRITDANDK
jgi:putative ABC transport system ATP-binding protein